MRRAGLTLLAAPLLLGLLKPPLFVGYRWSIGVRWLFDPHPSGATLEANMDFTRSAETAAKSHAARQARRKRVNRGKPYPAWQLQLRRNVVLYWWAKPSTGQQKFIDRCLAASVS